jgi:hypothetical protein
MISTAELERLMAASIRDIREEPAFFHALLDATLFAHTPKVEPPGRRQFVMFKSPDDGQYVIPVFTDRVKADLAARGNVRVLEVKGRELFDLTRGAALMLNPNDARCTLYPEEIERLLRDGTVVLVEKWKIEKGGQAQICKLERSPHALVKALRIALVGVRSVEVAYIAGIRRQKGDQPDSLVIVLGGEDRAAERSVRAVAIALYEQTEMSGCSVDVTHFDSRRAPPSWVGELGLRPIYRRRPMKTSPVLRGYN